MDNDCDTMKPCGAKDIPKGIRHVAATPIQTTREHDINRFRRESIHVWNTCAPTDATRVLPIHRLMMLTAFAHLAQSQRYDDAEPIWGSWHAYTTAHTSLDDANHIGIARSYMCRYILISTSLNDANHIRIPRSYATCRVQNSDGLRFPGRPKHTSTWQGLRS